MENKGQILEPGKEKSSNDMIKLLVGIVVVIAALVALKYLMSALGVI